MPALPASYGRCLLYGRIWALHNLLPAGLDGSPSSLVMTAPGCVQVMDWLPTMPLLVIDIWLALKPDPESPVA